MCDIGKQIDIESIINTLKREMGVEQFRRLCRQLLFEYYSDPSHDGEQLTADDGSVFANFVSFEIFVDIRPISPQYPKPRI
jgi:hypothetical protein